MTDVLDNNIDGYLTQGETNSLLNDADTETTNEIKSTDPFNEIIKLDDLSIQKVLREIDNGTIAKALKDTEDEVREKIFKNMSKRASTMLKEDMEYMGPVRLIDVNDSKLKILLIIKHLFNTGEIPRPEDFFIQDNIENLLHVNMSSINYDNVFKDINEFSAFLLNRHEPEKQYGFSHSIFEKITMCHFFETKGSDNILADIERKNKEQSMGNFQIPNTNIKLINFSICPKCRHIFSFKDLINYYANPKPDAIFKDSTEQFREDTRVLCNECNTYFLPALVISDGTPKNEVQFLCRVQTSNAIENFYINKYGKEILSKNKNNHLENKSNGKIVKALRNDVLLKKLSPKPTLVSNLLQYTPAHLALNLIDGSNIEKGDVLYGAWQ